MRLAALTPAVAAPLLLAACTQPQPEPIFLPSPTEIPAEHAALQPCASLTLQSPRALGAAFRSNATLDGVSFAAEGGAMACSTDAGGDAVCDVTGPGVVRVGGARGAIAFFDLPAGRTARVSMSHDIARCVLN